MLTQHIFCAIQRLHSLFYICLFYTLGIILSEHFNYHTQNISLLIGVLTLPFICLLYFCREQYKKILFISIVLGVACAAGSALSFWQKKQHSAFQNIIDQKTYIITGQASDIEQTPKGYLKTKITLITKNMWYTSNGIAKPPTNGYGKKIVLYTRAQNNIQIGDTIKIENLLFKKNKNESFNNYLIKESVAATAFIPKLEYKVMHRPSYSFARWLHKKKHSLFNTLKNKMSKKNFTLVAKIFFGNHNTSPYYTEQTKEQGKRWGVAHYFARSGLHLIIFVLLWILLFRFIPLPLTSKQIIILIVGIIYFLLSWPSTSFNRAFSTFFLYKLGSLFRLQTNFLHLLTLVCFATLILNPIQLFFLDFQLSFGLTFALALLNRTNNHKM